MLSRRGSYRDLASREGFDTVMQFRTPLRIATVGLLLLTALIASVAQADTVGPITFNAYANGTVNGQDGWSSTGSAGSGCAVYDHAIVDNSTAVGYSYPTFGAKSLRISSAVTSGCFSDQTFSKPVMNEAGETAAQNNGPSSGARQAHFEAQWDFASTVPGAQQVDQYVVASPDRGDGARMSWLEMQDTPTGLEVVFSEYVDVAPLGTLAAPGDGCGTGDDWQDTVVATALSRSVPHTIRLTMDLVDGPHNDVVKVFVDGTLRYTGTSWEDYYRWCTESGGGVPNDAAADQSRTVDSLLFRTGGADAVRPWLQGKGFLIDNLTLLSGPPVPTNKEQCKNGGWVNYARADGTTFKNQGDCIQYVNTGK
jgi:hypothetical protein